ncbi:uncharacterized protein OCT59_015367 [Rhizophagus irregularis]|uniref:Phosphatidylglycerol/phosphatidylinositol transfer protein n=1 Tax=Rhizophagus irregularis TaxID=588596 RepID=A0A915YYT4_9GLOM|nr:hypothetical protein OCT59_015367 [Rhizophagus irregularis]GBC18748.2 MD-2-related lipid recognition domain-containing protein [Rhizophagus irregularis DAOM 181602=DAOM 197198]CAB4463314.1 unnamed protein product [Rhizophagus irregularis]CAB5206911.1 unnamed protein product [Rhizophagus irregularis]CAB5354578.1 unnamed protein product [Rhizophagus irregularis]
MNKLFTITFLFVLFTTSLSSIIPRQLDPFKPCDITKTYPLTITTLSYSPNPIVAGGNLMLKIAGTTQVEVQQKSTLKIQMTYLPSKTLDFCDLVASYIPCPISVGKFNYTANIKVPNINVIIKSLINYSTITVTHNTELTCLVQILYIYRICNHMI